MKKLLILCFAINLASCTSEAPVSTEEVAQDSTIVEVDTTIEVIDTVAVDSVAK